MEPIFQFYSPMSPVPVDEVMESLDNQLESKLKIIDDLVKAEEKEMASLALIMETQERSERRRKRKRTECSGCPSTFKNACLDCKQNFASKKLKKIHEQKSSVNQELADLKEQRKSHQEAREMRRPAEIWEEARQKEYEAAQLDADNLKNEPMDDYESATNAESEATNGEELNNQADVKTEPSDFSIGMPNQVKTEPAEESPIVNNDVMMEAADDYSTSDEDMDSEPANDEAQNNFTVNQRLNERPWYGYPGMPDVNEWDAILDEF